LNHRPAEGLELVEALKTASRAVKKETGQVPWLNQEASLEKFFLWRNTSLEKLRADVKQLQERIKDEQRVATSLRESIVKPDRNEEIISTFRHLIFHKEILLEDLRREERALQQAIEDPGKAAAERADRKPFGPQSLYFPLRKGTRWKYTANAGVIAKGDVTTKRVLAVTPTVASVETETRSVKTGEKTR